MTNKDKYIKAFEQTIIDIKERQCCQGEICRTTATVVSRWDKCIPCPLHDVKNLCLFPVGREPAKAIVIITKIIPLLKTLPSEYFTIKGYNKKIFTIIGNKVIK